MSTMQTKVIDVGLSEIIHSDFEGFLDTIAERAFNTILAQEINYRVVGVASDWAVKLEITAHVPDADEDY